MKKFDAKARLEIEGQEKPIWVNAGMSVTIKSSQPLPEDIKVSVFDGRTTMNYYCFERKDRDQPAATPSQPVSPPPADDGFDDIPF